MRTLFAFLFVLALVSCGGRANKPEQTGETAAKDGGYLHIVEMDAAKAAAGIALDTIRLGRIHRDEVVEYRLGVRNTGTEPFVILEAKGTCGCTRTRYEKAPVQPGQTTTLTVTYDASGQQGSQAKLIRLRTSLAEKPYPLLLLAQVVVNNNQPR